MRTKDEILNEIQNVVKGADTQWSVEVVVKLALLKAILDIRDLLDSRLPK